MTDQALPIHGTGGRTMSERWTRWAARIVALLAILLLPCGVINHGDGAARYAQCRALLRGSLAIPPELSAGRDGQRIGGILRGAHGKLYSKYGVGPRPCGWSLRDWHCWGIG